jgi:hypothetical protein
MQAIQTSDAMADGSMHIWEAEKLERFKKGE